MPVRITGGELRGRRLILPRGVGVRPTSDMVRLAVFNSLGALVEGAQVVDLCAGTGALGIEALSRGAARAVFVESDPRVCAAIRCNLSAVGLDSRAEVVRGDAVAWLDSLATVGGTTGILFADPPYASRIVPQVVDRLQRFPQLVAAGGAVVLEGPEEDIPASHLNHFSCRWRRRYGVAWIGLYDRT